MKQTRPTTPTLLTFERMLDLIFGENWRKDIPAKEEQEKRLARESEIFSDYLYLARKMAKHDFTVFYQNLLSHIDVSRRRINEPT